MLVFQNGWGLSLLGIDSTDGIDPVILSMDYHVVILSRIRERHS